MSRTLILVVNVALVAACCFLAARMIAAVSGSILAPEAGAVLSQPLPSEPVDRSWDARQIIIGRNPFNASTLAPAAAPPTEEEEYAKTKLPLRLLGTAAHESTALSWAAVEDLEARSHQVVRVGDRLKGRADVLRIERRRIVLQNGARREELALEGENEGKPPQRKVARARKRPRARSRTPRVERLAENRFAVERNDVNQVANNPTALFSQARILPKYEDGQMVGVQLNAIKPGSVFEEIGIQDGDTITEFNGIQVTGQQESAQVLSELMSTQAFEVTVKGRDGQIRQLEYEIR